MSPGNGYVLSWDLFEFTPGIISVLQNLRETNWSTVLVTSQRGVGKGLMSADDLVDIHLRMQLQLQQSQAAFTAIYAYTETPDCPHSPKPDPEMLVTASKELTIDLSQSWIVGDSDRDIVMGRAASLKGCIRFLSGKKPEVAADYTVPDAPALKHLFEEIL